MNETNGMLGSICYYDGKYYFFYCDDIDPWNTSHWHLYYRWTNDVDELVAATSWSAPLLVNSQAITFGQLVKVAPAHDMDRWAVIYHAYRPSSGIGDICVQYTQNMEVVGPGGISDISYNDVSGTDSRYLGRAIGTLSGGATCYQHYFMTDPTGRLAVPDDKTQNATSGGLVTFADHVDSYLYCWGGKIYVMGWNLYVPQATVPSPADAATSVSTSADLSWNAGYKATIYDVYFGTTTAPPHVSNQVTTTYDPGTLQANKTYYWRVNAINGDDGSITIGKLWSFTTQ